MIDEAWAEVRWEGIGEKREDLYLWAGSMKITGTRHMPLLDALMLEIYVNNVSRQEVADRLREIADAVEKGE